MLQKSKKSRFICDSSNNDPPHRESLFTLSEETTISLNDLHNKELLEVKLKSGLFTSSLSSCVNLNIHLSGFLNVSHNSDCPLWNAQWCKLDGRHLVYFNYPPDEVFNSTPLYVLDIKDCQTIKVLTREECPRKNTLSLITKSGEKILFSCDVRKEFERWMEHFIYVLTQVRIWEK